MKGIVSALIVALVAVAANECPQDWHEDKLLVHEDCHKFYMCTHGEPVEMECWGDLYFNVENGQCDWQANVDCGERNISGKESTSVITDALTTPNSGFLENGCPVDPYIHWLLPVVGDCNGFYYCVWGELVLRACPPTLHFNPSIQVCDWPENAGCVTNATTTEAATTTAGPVTNATTTEAATTTDAPITNATTTEAATTTAAPVTNLTTTEAATSTDAPITTEAATTTDAPITNATTTEAATTTDAPDTNATTTEAATTTAAPETNATTTEAATTTDAPDTNATTTEAATITAAPVTNANTTEAATTTDAPVTNATTTESATTTDAPVTNATTTEAATTTEPPVTNTITTEAATTTDAPVTDATTTEATTTTDAPVTNVTTTEAATTTDAPVTNTITTEGTTEASTTTTDAANDPRTTSDPVFLENGCPVDPYIHWLLPVEGDCNGFYYCVWGELVLRSCPPTLYFNPDIQVCDWPENSGCVTAAPETNATTSEAATEASATTNEAATYVPSTSEPAFLDNGCPVDPHIHWLLPVEGDCNGFYYCVWGELVLRACPPTLHFNPDIQVCDWPEHAGCVAARSVNKHNLSQYYK